MAAPAAFDIASRLATILRIDPDHQAWQYQGRWETWGDALRRVEALDAILRRSGLGEGTKIGMITRNRPPHVATIAGVLSTRRCLVPITSIASDALVASEVTSLGVPAVVADEEDWGRAGLVEMCRDRGVLGVAVSADDPHVTVITPAGAAAAGDEKVQGVAVLMPTSGTTGPPKRIDYTYANIDGALGRVARYAPSTMRSLGGPPTLRDSVVLAVLSLAHVGGLWAVIQALAEGRRIALLDRFEPRAWADLVEEHQVKLGALPPATVRMLLDSDVAPVKLRSLLSVSCGTAPLEPETADAFTARFDVPVLTAYGATEFPGGLVGWGLEDYRQFRSAKRGSVGRARPGIEIKITDPETGRDVAPGAEGLVTVRSPQATAPITADGWVRTTDVGRMDTDGFLWIIGRADDAINRGGFKIVPNVVEQVLRDHPHVVDAAVAGVAEPRLGQVPVAAVVCTGATVTDTDLLAWCADRLAKHQLPVAIRIVDELPRTTSMKVSKEGVRALFAETD